METNVLYISSESELEGAGQSLCDMLKYIKSYVKPIVVIPDKGGLEEWLRYMDISFYVVPLSRGYGKIGCHTLEDEERDFRINYKAALQIKKIIEEEYIDLVHINSSVCNAGAMGAILAKVPYVWHIREILEEQFGCEFWDIKFKRLLFNVTNRFVTISKCVQDAYFCKYSIVSQFIYDGIDSERYIQEIDKEDNHNFLIAGNVSEVKGQLDAIKAVKILKEQGINDVHLHIVGRHSVRFEWCLNKYTSKYDMEENITLYSFTNDLSELRKKCAYAIISSKFEALGRVTVEAMMAGNIVIGADTGGTLELIGNEKIKGYIYAQGNPESLALTMLEAMNENTDVKDRMRAEAQSFAIETFNTKKYALSMQAMYQEVLVKKNMAEESFIQYLDERYVQYDEKIQNVVRNTQLKGPVISKIEERMINREEDIKRFLDGRSIKNIAIYGMGKLGCKLYDMLEKMQYPIIYVIDRDNYFINGIIKVLSPDEDIDKVDALIITAIDQDNIIKQRYLKENKAKSVFHLSEIVVEGNERNEKNNENCNDSFYL